MDDWELLRAYTRNGSEPAFAELLGRHVDAVYSTALRLTRDPHLAEEITLRAFQLLARKGHTLAPRGALIGWLHRTTCFLAKETWRTERRRRERETEALLMHAPDPETNNAWEQLAPLLDEAINQLAEADRAAILLRFFQRRPLREVGAALGVGEDAAKMRVARAIDKLRGHFARRGVVYPAATIAAALSARCLDAAPAGLAAGIQATLPAAGVGISLPASLKLLLLMAQLNLKTSIVGGVALLALIAGTRHWLRQNGEPIDANTTARLVARPAVTNPPGAMTNAASAGELDEKTVASIERLRALLHEPMGRRIPLDRIRQAVAELGRHRRAALPMLLEELRATQTGTGMERFHRLIMTTEALAALGTDAADALPELLDLLRGGKLAILNDSMPRLFAAIHPGADLTPRLIELLQTPGFSSAGQVGILITRLIRGNPGSEEVYRPALAALLTAENFSTRLQAASTLSQWPGAKEPAALSVLVEALKLSELRDPQAYAPIVDKASNTTYMRDGEKMTDNFTRFTAVTSLPGFGDEGRAALPALEEVAQRTDNAQLREAALRAIGKIDPARQETSEAIRAAVEAEDYGNLLAERAEANAASLDDLIAGLKYQRSVHAAAAGLARLGDEAKSAIPALEQALARWGDFEAAQALKTLAPEKLVTALNEPKARSEAASALGELGNRAAHAIPALIQALDATPMEDPGQRVAVAEAISKIDPQQPAMLLHFDDLHPAVTGLLEAARQAGAATRRKVDDIYAAKASDMNNVTRSEVIAFAQAVREVDPELHRLFVNRLVATNPSLKPALLPKP